MARWTRFVLRHRGAFLAFWLVVLALGGFASTKLAPLLSNSFAVPGTDSEHVRDVLSSHFGDRSDGEFTVVFQVADSHDAALIARLQRAVDRAAPLVPTGKATKVTLAGRHVVEGDIVSTLSIAKAKGYTDALLRSVGNPAGVQHTYITGTPALQHDIDPIFKQDLRHGELEIAVPIALLVLLAVFGL